MGEGFEKHTSHLLVSTSQRTASHWGGLTVYGENGGMQGFPGMVHWGAESEQLSTCPSGALQSLAWELSQVPGGGGRICQTPGDVNAGLLLVMHVEPSRPRPSAGGTIWIFSDDAGGWTWKILHLLLMFMSSCGAIFRLTFSLQSICTGVRGWGEGGCPHSDTGGLTYHTAPQCCPQTKYWAGRC